MALPSISLPADFFIMGYYLKLMHKYFNYPFFIRLYATVYIHPTSCQTKDSYGSRTFADV